MATHSSILAWKIPWMAEPGRLLQGVAESQTRLSDFTHSLKGCHRFTGPQQENPMLNWPLLPNSPPHLLPTSKSSLTGSEEPGSAAIFQAIRQAIRRRNGQVEPVRDLFISNSSGLCWGRWTSPSPRPWEWARQAPSGAIKHLSFRGLKS